MASAPGGSRWAWRTRRSSAAFRRRWTVPLLGAVAPRVAKSQSEQSRAAAAEEVKQEIADKARERIDTEARTTFDRVCGPHEPTGLRSVERLVVGPADDEGQTTEKRFTMQLRLAGEDQLGGHTPRPEAPADSLASVQVHESVLNNAIQRLQLNGRTFTLPELSKHVAARLNRSEPWETNPEHADVKITFAEKDAVIVRCQDDQIVLTLSIARLSKLPRKWKSFQIQAFYRPKIEGRSAKMVRRRASSTSATGQRLTTATGWR